MALSAAQEALLPPNVHRHSRDLGRQSQGSWYVAGSSAAAAVGRSQSLDRGAEHDFFAPLAGHHHHHHHPSTSSGGRAFKTKARPTLALPRRELTVEQTVETLRFLRRHNGLFAALSLAELEEFAVACCPLAFTRSELLFARGELATWFGVLLSGQVVAVLPDDSGSDIPLGVHGPAEVIGAVRASLWKQSYARAYTLRGVQGGYIAVMSYDQLEELQHTRPALHCALLSALLADVVDAAACFFRGCPLSCGVTWPFVDFHERRVLDFLLQFREEGTLFTDVGYDALLAVACRLRVTQWQSRSCVISRGSPLTACLLVLEGKLTGFQEAAGEPTAWFEPGSLLGLEGLLGAARPCALDVFAARPTLAGLLFAHDLEDLKREFPKYAVQVVRSLHGRFLMELAEPQSQQSFVLLADAGKRIRYSPGDVPVLPPGSKPWPGDLTREQAVAANGVLENTSLPVPGPDVVEVPRRGIYTRDDADDHALSAFMGGTGGLGPPVQPPPRRVDMQPPHALGQFLARKLAEDASCEAGASSALRSRSPPGRTREDRRSRSPGRTREDTAAHRPLKRSASAPAFARQSFGEGAHAAEMRRSQRRHGGAASARELAKTGGVEASTAAHMDLYCPDNTQSEELRKFMDRFRASEGVRDSAEGRYAPRGRKPAPLEERAPWRPTSAGVWRAKSAPASQRRSAADAGRSATARSLLHWRERTRDQCACPQCGAALPMSPDGSGLLVRVLSMGADHGDAVEFYINGQQVLLPPASRHGLLHRTKSPSGGVIGPGTGLYVLTFDPTVRPWEIASTWLYDTSASSVSATAANEQLAADLESLPLGRCVLVGVKGAGLEGLSRAAAAALASVGASPELLGAHRLGQGYVLLGCKGGGAFAERIGWKVDVEAEVPFEPLVEVPVSEAATGITRMRPVLEQRFGDLVGAFRGVDDTGSKHITKLKLSKALDLLGFSRMETEEFFVSLLQVTGKRSQGYLTLTDWLAAFDSAAHEMEKRKASPSPPADAEAGAVARSLLRRRNRHPGQTKCQNCSATLLEPLSADSLLARVISRGVDDGDTVEFHVDGQKITLPPSSRQSLLQRANRMGAQAGPGTGFYVLTFDPAVRPWHIVSTWRYDTSSTSASATAASAQLAADLESLPNGRCVLIGVKGSGLEGLSPAAIRALVSVGASSELLCAGRHGEGYALMGCKGGSVAFAEQMGSTVDIEGEVPVRPFVKVPLTEAAACVLRLRPMIEATFGDLFAAFRAIDDNDSKRITKLQLTKALGPLGFARMQSEEIFRYLLQTARQERQGYLTLQDWLTCFERAAEELEKCKMSPALLRENLQAPEALRQSLGGHGSSLAAGLSGPKDWTWQLEQQRRSQRDLRSSYNGGSTSAGVEDSVSADQYQAWNMKVLAQQNEIERLREQVRQLEQKSCQLQDQLAAASQEKEEWKATMLRTQLNREFKATCSKLEEDNRRFLQPMVHTTMPDFAKTMQQQMSLAATPLQVLTSDGVVDHHATEHRPPPALRTFSRFPGELGLL
eukprot:TRINITY_DN59536_c0_g1_i1.p1 TRINITY_DN59536_c0_g1~~TRINITY_DN59536_c0_g1_i1.p1  ORF type:complete len:1523 (-),score=373.60 TRINITY_DN59536_c0_g1_i1:19-4587(-)